jgi:hypothetical protein
MTTKTITQQALILLLLLSISLSSFGQINRYVRYIQNDQSSYGVIIDSMVHELTKAPYLGGTQTGKKVNLD